MNHHNYKPDFYTYSNLQNNNNVPQSIYDRDQPRPIVIPGNPWPQYVIVIISLFLILLAFSYIIYLVKTSPPKASNILSCAPGQCITNIYTGEKQCPNDSSTVLDIDPLFQTCNSPFTCESNITPFALRSDGSTNNFGLCEENVECRCLMRAQCANHVTAYFQTSNGNAFTGLVSQPVVFDQVTSYVDQQDVFFSSSPLRLENPAFQFCEISREFIGLNVGSGNQNMAGNRTYAQVDVNKPCLRGVLVYVPENVADFTSVTVLDTPLSCVQGQPCPEGQTPFWNPNTNQISCIQF